MEQKITELSELFEGVTFQFNFFTERMASFKSVNFLRNDFNMIQYEIEFFINDGNFFGTFMSFDELIDLHQLFEVREIPIGTENSKNLYHEKYKCHEKEILTDGTCYNCGLKDSDHKN